MLFCDPPVRLLDRRDRAGAGKVLAGHPLVEPIEVDQANECGVVDGVDAIHDVLLSNMGKNGESVRRIGCASMRR